jgi:phosphocarrier protein FPr
MVGIVIVSHSERLAEGIKELAGQMTQGRVPIETAGGIDDPDNPIGTDPMKVSAAIRAVHGACTDGVLVLMDLGSALISAETALDFLPAEMKDTVRLCAAPVVEGAVSAAVQASVGASLDAVAAEALAALTAKKHQLAPVTGDSAPGATAAARLNTAAQSAEARIIIRNRLGLHARPAANLVVTAGKFQSVITVSKGPKSASAMSINQIATLDARCNDEIRIWASGRDAKEAIAAIKALGAENFGEKNEEISKTPPPASTPTAIKDGIIYGQPASAGVAVGPAHLFRPQFPQIETCHVDDPGVEIKRLASALNTARKEVEKLAAKTKTTATTNRLTIFDVHRLILEDPDLEYQVQETIRKNKINADAAWLQIMKKTATAYRSLDNAYMQARADDVIDAGSRVLRLLIGKAPTSLLPKSPAILVADELLPSDVARLDPHKVLGIVTATGGRNSHAAILARSAGIPTVVGAGAAVHTVAQGALIALDGDKGKIWLCPDKALLAKLQTRRTRWLEKQRRARQKGQKPAVTTDGIVIHVTANIGFARDAHQAFGFGAEGVGLLRTEFLFQKRQTAPTEDEQHEAYVTTAKAMKGHPVIIRTLDVAADKPLAYLTVPAKGHGLLGPRGIRFCLAHPELFSAQLRALLRAAQKENIKIMFPMVTHLAELRAARLLLERAGQELRAEGLVCDRPVETGVMIEVPAAVSLADQLANEADFFSIGTNDLTQYVMAADRGNSSVARLCDSFHPAVLRMVHATVQAGHQAGIPVGLCGELAANPLATPLLIGLGLDELSMNAPAVPEIKATIRKLSAKKCRDLAEKALDREDADGVRQLLSIFGSKSP